MARSTISKAALVATAAAMALGGVVGTAYAQRDPAYAAARASGQVGEKMDGYLGAVGAETPEILRVIRINTKKRKEVYAERAVATGSTIEQYAFTAGCKAIAQTVPGEKYQAPDGTWQTRTSAPPIRDARCSGV